MHCYGGRASVRDHEASYVLSFEHSLLPVPTVVERLLLKRACMLTGAPQRLNRSLPLSLRIFTFGLLTANA